MSEAMTASIPVIPEPTALPKLQLLGDADAASCDGEFCEIPAHHEQAVINRRVDLDLICSRSRDPRAPIGHLVAFGRPGVTPVFPGHEY